MNRRFWFLFALIVALPAGLLLLAGCQGPSSLDGLIRAVSSAAEDGVVTPQELQVIQSQLPAPAFNWMQAVVGVASVAGSILGVKLLPTRVLQGPFDPKPPQSA